MSEFYVISQLTLIEEGPAVTSTIDKTPQLVHLKQGSLDGACGPYCLIMALIALGLEKHSKLSNLEPTKSSNKLFKMITDYGSALIREGTDLNTMAKFAGTYEKKGLKTEKISADFHGNSHEAKAGKTKSYNRVRQFVIDHVNQDRLVILGTANHWVLVVGLGFKNYIGSKDKQNPNLFLLLNPSEPAPKLSSWNGIMDISTAKKWFNHDGFTYEDALALWKG